MLVQYLVPDTRFQKGKNDFVHEVEDISVISAPHRRGKGICVNLAKLWAVGGYAFLTKQYRYS